MVDRAMSGALIKPMVRTAAVLWISFTGLCFPGQRALAVFDAASVFNSKCSACHSVGQGVVVGPDLQGVQERRERVWLHRFIRSSQTVIRSGDATARELFARFGKVMPDHAFSDEEIDLLVDFISRGGPREIPPPELRLASTATVEEVARGRALFLGEARFDAGGPACSHCHSLAGADPAYSGSLGSALGAAFTRLHDRGIASALRSPRHPLMRRAYSGKALTPDEVFALKAFLHQTSRAPLPTARALHPVIFAGIGSAALVLWLGRRRWDLPSASRRSS